MTEDIRVVAKEFLDNEEAIEIFLNTSEELLQMGDKHIAEIYARPELIEIANFIYNGKDGNDKGGWEIEKLW